MQYLVVQRKDSYAFVDFVRGKYSLENAAYVKRLLGGMTVEERKRVEGKSFASLWKTLWAGFYRSRLKPEYENAKNKFEYLVAGEGTGGETLDDMLWESASSAKKEPEWGFPKGRRNVCTESDLQCAIREMEEETGVTGDNVAVQSSVPFHETFVADNGVRYKHVYYVVRILDGGAALLPCAREIRNARWVSAEDVRTLMADSPSRIQVFDAADESVRLSSPMFLAYDPVVDFVPRVVRTRGVEVDVSPG